MGERTIFLAALEKEDPTLRLAFLNEACAGDKTMRQRVDALLRSHEGAGPFLEKPALQRAVEEIEGCPRPDETVDKLPAWNDAPALDFLGPSQKPGSLGRLGHYEVLEVIGHGGMGVVLRAFDDKLQRVVAVKVMAPQLAANATSRKRFVREAQAAAAVRNEHVIGIHAVEEENGLPYLVMDFIAGVSLQERLDRSGPLELKEVLRIGLQAALGLAAAHAQGLIHRDIKPANILLENGVERVRITDFGLARAVDDAGLTQTGVVAGTPKYMSPEQARGEPLDQRTDLFSLGSVLYVMCTGRVPFRASGAMAVLKQVCEATPRPVREVNAEVPDWLAGTIAQLQAKDPAGRIRSAVEVADLLGRHLARLQQPTFVPEAATQEHPTVRIEDRPFRRSGLRVALAAGFLLALGGIAYHFGPAFFGFLSAPGSHGSGSGQHPVHLGSQPAASPAPQPWAFDKPAVPRVQVSQPAASPAPQPWPSPVAGGDPQPFVILGRDGKGEQKNATLAEAVAAAADSDTIEIRGNGPFVSAAIPPVKQRRLTIRAGAGARPVLRWEEAPLAKAYTFLSTDSDLILEGLELQSFSLAPPPYLASGSPGLVESKSPKQPPGASLYVANCRFRLLAGYGPHNMYGIKAHSTLCTVRNCEFLGAKGTAIKMDNFACKAPQLHVMDNCVVTTGSGSQSGNLVTLWNNKTGQSSRVRLTRNTLAGNVALLPLCCASIPDPKDGLADKPYYVEAFETIFDTDRLFSISYSADNQAAQKERAKLQQPADAEALLRGMVDWQDKGNVYGAATNLYSIVGNDSHQFASKAKLADWNPLWGPVAAASRQGAVLFQGGDLRARARENPDAVTPEDFRLKAGSAGKAAGPNGCDLGADVDLVGPGPAYERWKQLPAYQQWLMDSAQKQ